MFSGVLYSERNVELVGFQVLDLFNIELDVFPQYLLQVFTLTMALGLSLFKKV